MLLAAAAACLHRNTNAVVLANAAPSASSTPPAPSAPPAAAGAGDTDSEADGEKGAAAELSRINKREKDIKRRIAESNGGLTREQAEAAYDHQEKFTALRSKHIEELKKKAAKK